MTELNIASNCRQCQPHVDSTGQPAENQGETQVLRGRIVGRLTRMALSPMSYFEAQLRELILPTLALAATH